MLCKDLDGSSHHDFSADPVQSITEMILCIETSTTVCSVALTNDGRVLALEMIVEPYLHASGTTRLIDRCLSRCNITYQNLSAVAVSIGPGSFTGLRVGLATAKGLCFALDIPLITIPTLQLLAVGASQVLPKDQPQRYCCMLDARRMEVYCGIYDERCKVLADADAVIVNNEFLDRYKLNLSNTVFVGNGAPKLQQLAEFDGAEILNIDCSAKYMVKLADLKHRDDDYSDVASIVPKYLKPPNITKARKVI